MVASAQIAIYPLRQERLTPAIEAVQQALRSHGLEVKPGPMSTYAVGEADSIFAALHEAFVQSAATGQVVMTVTVSNACQSPTDPLRAGQFGPDVYANWRASSLGEITEALEHRLIFRLAGSLHGCSVLDVGCGDGTQALLSVDAGAAHVTACDPDPRMIARARAKTADGDDRIDLLVARSQVLPFADSSFDIVTCVAVLAFVSDADIAIREMARVLHPGGRLVIGDLGRWSMWAARRRIRSWFGTDLWRTARFRTATQFAELIMQAGLMVGSIQGAIFFPPWTSLARVMAPFDPSLGKLTTLGAAFVAVQATKPGRGGD